MGYDGGLTAEMAHDPFFPILLAAQATERIELGTGIAVAFARSPMTLANIGYDLQQFSEGRFILGLGSQIKAHVEKRFSMPWSSPAARMREFILAMRAIWGCLERRREARLPRRVLPTHPDDTVLQPGPESVRQPEGLPRGGGREDDRGRGRGVRRDHPARLHHRAVRARGVDARRSNAGGRRVAGREPTSRSPVRCSSSPAPTKRSSRRHASGRSGRSRSTDPRRRTAAFSSCTDGATSRPS